MTNLFHQQPDIVRPRQTVWRGVVQARALWFDGALLDEATTRPRVLDVWQNGAVAHRFDDGLLLLWPTSQRVVCERATALPLVENRGVLLASPLSEAENAQLFCDKASRVGALVLVQNGAVQVRRLRDAKVEDLSQWIDVAAFRFQGAQSLGAAPVAAPLVLQSDFDARQKLTKHEAAPELQRVLDALRGEKLTTPSTPKSGFQWPQMPPLRGVAGNLWNALDGVRSWQKVRDGNAPMPLAFWWILFALVNWIFGGNWFTFLLAIFAFWVLREILPAVAIPNTTSAGAQQTSSTRAPSKPRREKKPFPLNGFLARAIMRSRLANLIGGRHARYILQMMEMFERGDLDAALRHAIPLGADGDASSNPFLGRLTARKDLNFNAGQSGAGSSVGFGEELQTRLRAMYRRAFENLRDRERYEEAAFVLAELLQSNEEAVDFLEMHDRKLLAAQMAEARALPAGLVVRQWFIAGDEERAVAVARRGNAWADAVFRLEQRKDERADYLRVLWARNLAHSGQYAAAMETLWPVEAMREHARVFAQMALESGGAPAAKALARLLELDEINDDLRYRVLELTQNETREDANSRLVFAQTLRAASQKNVRNNATRAAARLAARSLLRDANNEYSNVDHKMWRGLVDLAGDAALRTDVPALPSHTSSNTLSTRSSPLDISISADDTGSTSVFDAALLPDGKTLVALGEAGAQLLNREGRVVHRFDQPCHKFVLSDGGDRAIALAPRGRAQSGVDANYQPQWSGVYRLSHLDMARKSSRYWCEAALQSFADSYDGSTWFAGVARELAMIDALNPRFAALWKSGDTSGEIRNVARSAASCSLLTYSQQTRDAWNRVLENRALEVPREKCERWTFSLSQSPTLRERVAAPPLFSGMLSPIRSVSAAGRVLVNAFQEVQNDENANAQNANAQNANNVIEMFHPRGWLGFDSRVVATIPPVHNVPRPAPSRVLRAAPDETWIAAPLCDERGAVCYLLDSATLQVRARLDLGGATNVSVRFVQNHLVLADDLGRILALDLNDGSLARDLRV